jgi:3-methylfumaryl-CoA hydratase
MTDRLEELEKMLPELEASIGHVNIATDTVLAGPVARLAATLDCAVPAAKSGEPIPAGWHCLYCLPSENTGDLDADGLPRDASPIPYVPLERRVFGGATLEFADTLRIGDEVSCETELTSLALKSASAGPILIATVERRYGTSRGLAIVEKQDIVHLDAPQSNSAKKPSPDKNKNEIPEAEWERTIVPSIPYLFRFSALTFNSHRIHYDREYAVNEEGQNGALVQGRLLSLLCMELLRDAAPDQPVRKFSYRSTAPVHAEEPVSICMARADSGFDLWVHSDRKRIAQKATAYI